MGYYVDYRKPSDYYREREHFATLDEAKNFVLTFIKDNIDFYKTCSSLDYGCFDIHPDFEYGQNSTIHRYIATKETCYDPEYFELTEELVDSFIYRQVPVNIYEDDYGQCYYFKCMHNNELIEDSCGGWNPDYKSAVTSAIDYMLDRS